MQLKHFLKDNDELRKSYLNRLFKILYHNPSDEWALAYNFSKMDWSEVSKELKQDLANQL